MSKIIRKYFALSISIGIIGLAAVIFLLFSFWPAPASCVAGVADVYYSVGQNTNDHKTGSPTITISGNTATFSVPQTATNMGVGDKISYGYANATTTAYISGKISSTTWSVITKIGGQPTATTTAAVLKISHAFANLNAAVGGHNPGASGADYLNSTSTVSGNYILNIPCYYDSGPDATAITISDWDTGASNFINIYTPNNTINQVNQSQRHGGVWNDARYALNKSLAISQNYVKIEGLQISVTIAAWESGAGIAYSNIGNADEWVSKSIIRGVLGNNISNSVGIKTSWSSGSHNLYVWDNIIYGWLSGAGTNSGNAAINKNWDWVLRVYNNTIYGCYTGVTGGDTSTTIINNLFRSNTIAAAGTFAVGTDYNSTDNATMGGSYAVTGGGNIHDRVSQTFTFADEAGKNFHLSSNDTGALNRGTSSVPGISYSDDIDSENRSSPWDIGADEYFVNPPLITLIASSTTDRAATITWTTNINASSSVEYGLTAGYGLASSSNSFVTAHSIHFSGLLSNTPHHFRVSSGNGMGTSSVSGDYIFTTAVRVTPPILSSGYPSGGLATGTDSALIGLTTDENAICKYSTVAGTAYASMTGVFGITGTTSHQTLITGLSDGHIYHYFVRCQDSSLNTNTNDYEISFYVNNDSGIIYPESCSESDVGEAINLASAGGVVEIPSGVCSWDSALTLNSPITIKGQTIVSRNKNTFEVVPTDATVIRKNGFIVTATTGVRITGLTFSGLDARQNIGAADTQFDITNPTANTYRYTWTGVGTNPFISCTTTPIDYEAWVAAQNFSSKPITAVTGCGINYFEIYSAAAIVVESGKTIGSGRIAFSGKVAISLPTSPVGMRIDHNHFSYYVRIWNKGSGGGYLNVFFDNNRITQPMEESLYIVGAGNDSWADGGSCGSSSPEKTTWLEDNEFILEASDVGNPIDMGEGARVVIRHNRFSGTAAYKWGANLIEAHGHCWGQRDGVDNAGMYCLEVSSNILTNPLNPSYSGQDLLKTRGGKNYVYNNNVQNTGWHPTTLIGIWTQEVLTQCNSTPCAVQEHEDVGYHAVPLSEDSHYTNGLCTTYPCPMQVNNSYIWANTRDSGPFGVGVTTGTEDYAQRNRDWWDDTGGVNFTKDVSANRPATCTAQDSYWETDTNTLYRCTAINTWTAEFASYVYPHPFTATSTMGTNSVDIGAGARVFGNSKFYNLATTTSGVTADLSIIPASGDLLTNWMDVTIATWQKSGAYRKTWTESSANMGSINTTHAIGDLKTNTAYNVKVDNVLGANITGAGCTGGVCTSNGSGYITFNYSGGYSEHEFDVEESGSDITAPIITLTATSTTATTATITWTTNENATSSVRYGTSISYNLASSSNIFASSSPSHSITLHNLATSTTYHFQIGSTDASGNRATSSDHIFTTLAPTYTITASTGANGTVTPSGVTTKNYGTSQAYTIAITTAGYHVADILVDGVSVGTSSLTYTFSSIHANHTISATFSNNSTPTTYTIGGTISGLTSAVILQNNGKDDLTVSANGSFTFATATTTGKAYAVTVLTNPSGQTCTVSSGSGTVSGANITSVSVSCSTNSTPPSGGGGGGGGSAPSDTTPPGIPANFRASSTVNTINLAWTNPTDSDYAGVKLYRKLNSAPTGQTDALATLAYSGTAHSFANANLPSDSLYYYSLYSYDTHQNYSLPRTISIRTATSGGISTTTAPVIEPVVETPAPSSGNSSGNITSLIGANGDTVNTVTAQESQTLLAEAKFAPLTAAEIVIYKKIIALATKVLSDVSKYAFADFIHFGTPTTVILGAGERGGSIASFRSAFGRLPETALDWQDVVKIGNGRWTTQKSATAEAKAKISFKKIYLREPNMKQANDNAAVNIMAYGLRPAQRNLKSEKTAILSFKYIFRKAPVSAADWDIVRAIAYSGAKR